MPSFQITVPVECENAAQALKVQKMLTDLAAINGARGLMNLQKKLDTSKFVKGQVQALLLS